MRASLIVFLVLSWAPQLYSEAFSISYPGFDPNDLGKSINIATGEVLGDCMTGQSVESSNRRLSHSLSYSQESIDLHRRIHGSLGGSLSLGGLLGFGSSVELTKEIHANKTSVTVVFNMLYNSGSVFLDNPQMVDEPRCGNYYVSGYNYGSVLAVGIKFRFKSKQELSRFKRKVTTRGLFGLFKKSKTEIKEIRKHMKGSTLISRVSMEGASDETIDALGKRHVCQAKNLEKCLEAIGKVLDLVGPSGGYIDAVNRFEGSGERFVLSVFLRKPNRP